MAQSDKEPINLGKEEPSSDDDLLSSLSGIDAPEENENTMQRLSHLTGFEQGDADESTTQRLSSLSAASEGDFDSSFSPDGIDVPAAGEDTVARLSRFEEEQNNGVGEDTDSELLSEDSTLSLNNSDIVGGAFEDTDTGENSAFYTQEDSDVPLSDSAAPAFPNEEFSSTPSQETMGGGDPFGDSFGDEFSNDFPPGAGFASEGAFDGSSSEEPEPETNVKNKKPKKKKKKQASSKKLSKKTDDTEIDKSGGWLLWVLLIFCAGIWAGGNIWGFATAAQIGKGTQLPFFLTAFNSFGAVLMMTPFLLFALRRRSGKITFFDSALALAYILMILACMILVVIQARYGVKITPPVM